MSRADKTRITAQDVRSWRTCSDEQLLAQCRLETFRGPGPGGQKRNKTSSAVRLVHEPSGFAATAGESRSQALNRRRALHRLREKMTLELRDGFKAAPADFVETRLRTSPNNDAYWQILGTVLDALEAAAWSLSDAAATLGVNTARLVSFLEADPDAWDCVNRHRTAKGMRSLRQRA